MVFGNCGVLTGITSEKSYVEMTGIDAETSQDIAEAIKSKEGRYLEAQVQGSKTQAQEGTLVILAAGDRSLFDECQSCFEAMGKNSFYLGGVGNASKMNLVLQLMAGVTLAGLAESMALADRAGLQQKDVLEVLELTSLACPAILDKGKGRRINLRGIKSRLIWENMKYLFVRDNIDHDNPGGCCVNSNNSDSNQLYQFYNNVDNDVLNVLKRERKKEKVRLKES